MLKKRLFFVLLIIMMMVSISPAINAQDKVQVHWFVGLGTGTDPAQIEMQEKVVEEFNASQDEIELILTVAPDWEAARDAMSTLIAAGDAPDIVGPVGGTGHNAYAGNWLDLQPLVDAAGYDLSQFPEAAVNFYRTDEGLVGLPLATFPSFIFYNKELFDEADLPYPPSAYGEPYIDWEGNEKEWNIETMTELAMLLTVDANGYDATEPEFDKENVVQWGFAHQWPDMRNEWTFFGAGTVVDPETGEAVIPDHWREASHWYHDAIFELGIAPTFTQVNSDALGNDNAFGSGNVAMARTHLWYTCCLDLTTWDAAPMPSYNGQVTTALHADTFRVMKTTENPEATFEVLSYLVGEASLDLLSVYGGMPAREADRATFFAGMDEKYTQGVNWQVVQDSLNYPDIPTHETLLPNNNKAFDRMETFQDLLWTEPNLDVDAELDKLQADLQAIFEEEDAGG